MGTLAEDDHGAGARRGRERGRRGGAGGGPGRARAGPRCSAAACARTSWRGSRPSAWTLLAPLADLVLVEADGARGRSLKVPAPHEPVIPALDHAGGGGVRAGRAGTAARRRPRPPRGAGARGDRGRSRGGRGRGLPGRRAPPPGGLSVAHPRRAPAPGVFLNKAEDDAALDAGARLAAAAHPALPLGGGGIGAVGGGAHVAADAPRRPLNAGADRLV